MYMEHLNKQSISLPSAKFSFYHCFSLYVYMQDYNAIERVQITEVE